MNHTPEPFETFQDAFEYCRRVQSPVVVVVLDDEKPGRYKLYPSGTAKFICSLAVHNDIRKARNE